ncbi:amino acid transporter [Synergistales bacterium]|nr:amino acid transporter [Synergistales bacterium]
MFLDGLRFGLLLQFAVGPICLMVFNAGALGFYAGALAALAVTLVDGLYIFLAAIGIAVFLQSARVKRAVRVVGSVVLILFGLDIITGALGFSLLPQIALFNGSETDSVFLKAVLMTASNPLTIIFWGGVFSTNILSKNMNRSQLFLFGVGCASATFIFLNCVAAAGSVVKAFLPKEIMICLNVVVGAVIVFFALKMAGLFKKGEKL